MTQSPNGNFMKQNLPQGVSNGVNNWEDGSRERVQNLQLASILDMCVKPFTLLIIFMNLFTLWTLCCNTVLRVLGSKHTHNLPLGLMTMMRA